MKRGLARVMHTTANMPTPQEILIGLSGLANQWAWLAVLWHLVLALVLWAVITKRWSATTRVQMIGSALPLLSVSTLAWTASNPFNGSVFALTGLLVLGIALRTRPISSCATDSRWQQVCGGLSLAFAWFYPHFLANPWAYLIASPFGIVPCPTLAALLGLGLVLNFFGSRAWATLLGVVGLFYGAFGVLRLGVTLDIPLIAVSLVTLVVTVAPVQHRATVKTF